MLDERRLSRVIEKMTTDSLLITDPISIAYLCASFDFKSALPFL